MKKILLALVAFCLMFALCACGTESDNKNTNDDKVQSSQTESASSVEESSTETAAAFNVTVVDQNGNAVSGVMVQVCKDTCLPAVTNAEGVATFATEITDEHYLSVSSCPAGYEYTGEVKIYLEDGMTEYTLEITAKEEA